VLHKLIIGPDPFKTGLESSRLPCGICIYVSSFRSLIPCFSSDEDMHSFMEHHRRAMSVQRERESMARESVTRGDSVLRESMTRELRSGRDSMGRSFSVLEETRESSSS